MRLFFSRLIITLFILGLCSCAHQGRFNCGKKAFQAHQYERAFFKLKPQAEKGQVDAQYALGYMYYYGKGVVENRKEAYFWIKKAANAGQRDAIEALQRLKQAKNKAI